MGLITVQYYKHPRIPHWRYAMERLGADEHGVWLGARAGTVVQRGDEPAITAERPFVQLITPDRWWTLIANDGGSYPLYVDVVSPARWPKSDLVEMVDLDLDVVRRSDGLVAVLDEDEFEEHRRTLAYPDKLVTSARVTTAEIALAVEKGSEPFGFASRPWLERLGGE